MWIFQRGSLWKIINFVDFSVFLSLVFKDVDILVDDSFILMTLSFFGFHFLLFSKPVFIIGGHPLCCRLESLNFSHVFSCFVCFCAWCNQYGQPERPLHNRNRTFEQVLKKVNSGWVRCDCIRFANLFSTCVRRDPKCCYWWFEIWLVVVSVARDP